MRSLGWYLAGLLAAYSLATSWSLGVAAERVAAIEQRDVQLAAELDATRSRVALADQTELCRSHPYTCEH